MGLNFLGSSSFYDMGPTGSDGNKSLPNPDPSNYAIIRYKEINRHLVVIIQYLDCLNYEGMKIMVYKDTTLKELKAQKLIDPHFSEDKKFKSPIARFEPTEDGWEMAINFTKTLK